MLTKFGDLNISAVLSSIEEFRKIGESAFLQKYANGYGARSTWIAYEGEYFPSKAIFRAAFFPKLLPRSFQTSDTYVFARELGLELIRYHEGILQTRRSAIDDLDDLSGTEMPPRIPYSGERFIRDSRVRTAVLQRANGKCEHCGAVGFITRGRKRYLEAHHIISLAQQGPDTLENVIALCPNDHRRAHFSKDRESFEVELKAKLLELRDK